MTIQTQSKSLAVVAYESKLLQLSSTLSEVQEQLEQEMMGLLSPKELVALWKLRDVLGQTSTLLSRSLKQAVTKVTGDMLDMVVQIERIVAHAQSQVERLRS